MKKATRHEQPLILCKPNIKHILLLCTIQIGCNNFNNLY